MICSEIITVLYRSKKRTRSLQICLISRKLFSKFFLTTYFSFQIFFSPSFWNELSKNNLCNVQTHWFSLCCCCWWLVSVCILWSISCFETFIGLFLHPPQKRLLKFILRNIRSQLHSDWLTMLRCRWFDLVVKSKIQLSREILTLAKLSENKCWSSDFKLNDIMVSITLDPRVSFRLTPWDRGWVSIRDLEHFVSIGTLNQHWRYFSIFR